MLLGLCAVIVAAGLLAGRPLAGGLAGAVVALAAANRWVRVRRTAVPEVSVVLDDAGVTVAPPGATARHVAWGQLVEVSIVTTSDGPLADDVFFLLRGADRSGCVVPGPLSTELLVRLGRLPGFDHRKVIEAMGSTTDAGFVCWRGAPGDALAAAPAAAVEPAGGR